MERVNLAGGQAAEEKKTHIVEEGDEGREDRARKEGGTVDRASWSSY